MNRNYTTDYIKLKFGINSRDIAITCYPTYGNLVQYTIRCRKNESSMTIDVPSALRFERLTSNDDRFQKEINNIMEFKKSQVTLGIKHSL